MEPPLYKMGLVQPATSTEELDGVALEEDSAILEEDITLLEDCITLEEDGTMLEEERLTLEDDIEPLLQGVETHHQVSLALELIHWGDGLRSGFMV